VETNWKNVNGFDIHKYHLSIDTVDPSKTMAEQQTKIEKISLVSFLDDDQRKNFVKICRRLKHDDHSFYQNKNLHVTLFGFGPLEEEIYELIQEKIHQFSKQNQVKKIDIGFDCIRPGATYTSGKTLAPLQNVSNGTVIAFGDVAKNVDFCNYSNKLTLFLLSDEKIRSKLGVHFRRKFPSIWCTLGYYDKKRSFKVGNSLEKIFNQYSNLNSNKFSSNFTFPISEFMLVKSKYKNLRYPKIIGRFRV
jgi:hypothetical protein